MARIRELFDQYEVSMAKPDAGEELFTAVVNEVNRDHEAQLAAVHELIEAGVDVNYVSLVTGSGNDGHTP